MGKSNRLSTASQMRRRQGREYSPRSNKLKTQVIGGFTIGGCALFAFDDISVLRNLGGGLLASPSWILLVIAGFMAAVDTTVLNKRVKRLLIWFFFYGAAISLVSLPLLSSELLGENAVLKVFKFGISVAVWLLVLAAGAILVTRCPKAVLWGASVAGVLMLAGAVLYQLGNMSVDQSPLIHTSENVQQRVRSTRFEPSALGAGLLTCLGLVCLSLRGRGGLLFLVLGLFVVSALTQSRGTAVTISIVAVLALILIFVPRRGGALSSGGARNALASFAAGIAIVLSFRMDAILSGSIWNALGLETEGTSDASRSIWAESALASLAGYPFGMGYAGYLAWLPPIVADSTQSVASEYRLAELSEMIGLSNYPNESTLSPKNLVGVSVVHFGIVGLVLIFLLYAIAILRSLERAAQGYQVRLVVALMVVILSSTYYSSIFSWDQAFLLGALCWGARPRSSTTKPSVRVSGTSKSGWAKSK